MIERRIEEELDWLSGEVFKALSLGDSLQEEFSEKRTCDSDREIPCLTGYCASLQCVHEKFSETFGVCPVISTTDPMCTDVDMCLSDKEGCYGNDKCCMTECGGKTCMPAEIGMCFYS